MSKLIKDNFLSLLLLGVILLLHGLILTRLIFFPYPELFIYPYLTNYGLIPYKQVLDQHFPGLLFLPVNFDNLGMQTPQVARVWLIVTIVITQTLLFLITKKILKNPKKALLVNVLYLLWQPFFEGWVLWIDSFLPLLLLPALLFLLNKRHFLSGLFLSIAIIFKQTIIPLSLAVFLYLFFEKQRNRKILNYFLGLLIPISLMTLFFISKGIFLDFWYWTVTFNLTVYASTGTQIPKSFGFITRIFVVYAASLSGFLRRDYKNNKFKIILFLFFFGSLVGAFDRANFVHFQPSLPFVVILTTLGIFSLNKEKAGLALISVYVLIALWWQIVFFKGHLSNKIFFFDQSTYQVAGKIMQYTKPGDKIFVYGGVPHLYQMSNTLPAGNVFVFQFPWFLKVSEDRILQGIEEDKPKIIVYDTSYKVEGVSLKTFSTKIFRYIESNYQKIDNIGDIEILQRRN